MWRWTWLGPTLIVLLIGPMPVVGQTTIAGRVVDDSTGKPLPHTHVFISHSTIGTTADSAGRFRLTDIPAGATRLHVSHVGYESYTRNLLLRPDTTLQATIRLRPTVIKGEPLTVLGERDAEWYDRLDRFRRLFLGPDLWPGRCEILNPEVLRFDTAWWGKFEAEARRPLVIENRALGYRVTYYLREFEARGDLVRWDGEPVFERLTPRDSAEAQRWAENRRRAFRGSLRHFLLSLLHDRLEAEGFRMYRQPRPDAYRRVGRPDRVPTPRDRVVTRRSPPPHELNFSGRLVIVYEGESEHETYLEWGNLRRSADDHQTSLIRLNERPVHIDRHGEIVEPYGATLYRYFAFTMRLASLLPTGYRPPDDTTLTAVLPP